MLGDLTLLQYGNEFFGLWQTINNAGCSRVNKKQCTQCSNIQKTDGKP